MKDLFLNFSGTDGEHNEFQLENNSVIVGRHSECGIKILDSRLSREHIKLERDADVFRVTELGSSNGTTLNGEPLVEPIALSDGDILVLGGGVEICVSIIGQMAEKPVDDKAGEGGEQKEDKKPPVLIENVTQDKGFQVAFILAPIMVLFILLSVGIGSVLLFGGSNDEPEDITRDRSNVADENDRSTDAEDGTPSGSPETLPSPGESVAATSTATENSDPLPTASSAADEPSSLDSNRQAEALVYAFMKRIAKNDQRPFLTGPRIREVVSRINRFRGSNALASNIRNAITNSGQITQTARSKNLQPQFLAAAALTSLGGNQGNVAGRAVEMADTLDKLTIVLSNELADDALLVIVAYDEGVQGNYLKMRDRLAGLAKRNPTASSREIRTIWFLKERGEITSSQYEFALNFLAIGTITQNPKLFGVNSEALRLN